MQSQNIFVNIPPAKPGGSPGPARPLAFSGNCMTVVQHHTRSNIAFISSEPIDVAGMPVAPQPGYSIVVDARQNGFFVAKCTVTQADLTKKADPCLGKPTGDLYLALGSGSDKSGALPGIWRMSRTSPPSSRW